MKKRKNILGIVLCMALLMGVPVYAYDHDSGWNEWEDCDWTPDFSDVECHGALGVARCRSDFSFDTSTYNIVCDAFTDDEYYFTVEHRTITDYPMTASQTDLFSYMPNVHFDYDDDDSDGHDEEVEAICLSPEDLQTNYNYYFASWWDIEGSMTYGAFDVITQLSKRNWRGEYNEKVSDYITSVGFNYSYSSNYSTNVETNNAIGTMSFSAENITDYVECDENEVEKFVSGISDISELENYKNDITNQYLNVKNNNNSRRTASNRVENELIDNVDAVITFTEPVSLEYLESLLGEECSLVNYEAKIINSSNDWMTMLSKRMDQEDLMCVATTMAGEDDLVFCGVTSATVNIPVNDNTYDILCAEEKIYLVDMSEYIIKMQLNDFAIDVDVSDCYYYLEKWN